MFTFESGLDATLYTRGFSLITQSSGDLRFELWGTGAKHFRIDTDGIFYFEPQDDWDGTTTTFKVNVSAYDEDRHFLTYYYRIEVTPDHAVFATKGESTGIVSQKDNKETDTEVTNHESEDVTNITMISPQSVTIEENNNWSLFYWLKGISDDKDVRFTMPDDYDGPLQITADTLHFKNSYNGEQITGFDYETDGPSHTLAVIARSDNAERTFDFTIHITDVEEELSTAAIDGFA